MENPIKMDDLGVPLFSETMDQENSPFPYSSWNLENISEMGSSPKVGEHKKYSSKHKPVDDSEILPARVLAPSQDYPRCFHRISSINNTWLADYSYWWASRMGPWNPILVAYWSIPRLSRRVYHWN